jgi:hypothetical protein
VAFGTPADPVSGTVITVAYAVANLLDPLRWLRALTGGGDPPGTDYVAISTSTTATTWRKVPTGALADLAVTNAKLATGAAAANLGAGGVTNALLGTDVVDDRVLAAGAAAANLGTGGVTNTLLAADVVDDRVLTTGAAVANIGYTPANRTNGDTFGGTVIAPSVQLNSGGSVWQWIASGTHAFFGIPSLVNIIDMTSAGINLTGTATVGGSTIITQANDGTLCDAASVAGKVPTTAPSAGALPLADAAGKLDAWVTPSGGTGAVIPPGLLCHWETATPPSGWVIDTRWDGMMIAMKGGPFSSTLGQTGGGSTHDHSFNNQHSHSGAALGVGGTIDASGSTINGRFAAGGGNALPDNHTHAHSLDVSGSTDAAQSTSQSVGSVNHLPPYVSLNLIRKT